MVTGPVAPARLVRSIHDEMRMPFPPPRMRVDYFGYQRVVPQVYP